MSYTSLENQYIYNFLVIGIACGRLGLSGSTLGLAGAVVAERFGIQKIQRIKNVKFLFRHKICGNTVSSNQCRYFFQKNIEFLYLSKTGGATLSLAFGAWNSILYDNVATTIDKQRGDLLWIRVLQNIVFNSIRGSASWNDCVGIHRER